MKAKKKQKEVRSFFDVAVIAFVKGLVADMERITKTRKQIGNESKKA